MPRDGAITFGDLVGKLDVLEVACDKCGRKGRYAVARLIEQRGPDGKIVDLLSELRSDCPSIRPATWATCAPLGVRSCCG
jgi:hypothetical protein